MIGSLKGSVESLGIDNCIIETAGGVGYRVFMPAAQLAQLTQGAAVRLHIHTAVREDAIVLYGFLSQEYYDLFELLLTISGVGPKMALGILSAVKPDAFYLAVQSRDIKVLTKLPGIGKKTAERLLLELKDKVAKGFVDGISLEDVAGASSAAPAAAGAGQAIAALVSLGYSQSEAAMAVSKIDATLPVEEIIKLALRGMAGRR